MESLNAATSVAAIVAREPDASGLLPYLETNLTLPPPQDVAERIWGLLVRDVAPHSAKAHQQMLEARYGNLPYAEFQLMRLVADTCQIQGFCLADLRRASRARWASQMQQVDAFLASRAIFNSEYGPKLLDIRKLELEEQDLSTKKAELIRKAAPLQSQREAQQAARARTLQAITDVGRHADSLSEDITGLEAELATMSQTVSETRSALAAAESNLAQLRRHIGELRPVLARGVEMLESDSMAVEERIDTVRKSLAGTHARAEAYGFAQEALKALREDLERLVSLKAQSVATASEKRTLETRLTPLELRLRQLQNDQVSVVSANDNAKAEKGRLKSIAALAKHELTQLNEQLDHAAKQLDLIGNKNDEIIRQLEKDLDATSKNLDNVERIVRLREQWLSDFQAAELASSRMEHELAFLREWSVQVLD